eukprot:TRINITY_DN75830_c0_g1_i1.p1 TRINITY_DN75830_c0_g1~~TRINITY_DN75830_c0_g1_i1.p1  ORF type:complete len:133 (-),score=21.14 TRINITY_DN75830_c0_g1_i1:36-434(-)
MDEDSDTEAVPSVSVATTARTSQTLRANIARKRQKKARQDKKKRMKLAQAQQRKKVSPSDTGNENALEFERFLEELEEDEYMRQNVHIYRNHDSNPQETPADEESESDEDGTGEEQCPSIPLSEMLDDLRIE